MGILRLLLALVVVFGHVGKIPLRMIGPELAVETFFMISGFYMAMVLNEKYMPDGRVTLGAYKLFFRARLMRLFPLYFAVLLLTCLAQSFMLKTGHIDGFSLQPALPRWVHDAGQLAPSDKGALLLTNLTMFGQDVMMFLGIDPQSDHLYFTSNFAEAPLAAWNYLIIPQAWSLSIELWFYLLAPFLVTRSVTLMSVWALASLAVRFVLLRHAHLDFDPWTYRFFPSELWIFLVGALAYRFYRWMRGQDAVPVLGYAALALSVGSILFLGRGSSQIKVLFHLAILAVSIPLVFLLTKNFRVDRYIGELSYPLYMVHVLVLQVLIFSGLTKTPLLVVACVISAVGMLYAVDLPVERFRQRWVNRHRPAQAPPAAASLAA